MTVPSLNLGPSLIIAFLIAGAFGLGRLAAYAGRHVRAPRAIRFLIISASILLLGWMAMNGAQPILLLVPVALAAGFFTHGHDDLAPGLFS